MQADICRAKAWCVCYERAWLEMDVVWGASEGCEGANGVADDVEGVAHAVVEFGFFMVVATEEVVAVVGIQGFFARALFTHESSREEWEAKFALKGKGEDVAREAVILALAG